MVSVWLLAIAGSVAANCYHAVALFVFVF